MTPQKLRRILQTEGANLFRPMPWRDPKTCENFNQYHILVSEMMLQQTQASRVEAKYLAFIQTFPSIHALANAQLSEVLALWNGLGYNRRALYLHNASKQLSESTGPWSVEQLVACKGIGINTAKAVVVYSQNRPQIFVETNVRTVCIHYFFADQHTVTDQQIAEIVEACIDTKNPRQWYWMVMDLGYHLKKANNGHLQKAKSYKKQPAFKGSLRQVRGKIIQRLSVGPAPLQELHKDVHADMTTAALNGLEKDGLLHIKNGIVYLGTTK